MATVKAKTPVKKAVKAPSKAKEVKTTEKKAVKTEKAAAPVVVKEPTKEKKTAVAHGLKAPLFAPTGKEDGTIDLPAAFFGAKENPVLVAQAVRVYLANQREGSAQAKTRGEVEGSTRKIYKQKGTGRARHGGIRAPIFVGGGIVFGPRAHSFTMDMPQKMRVRALASALTSLNKNGGVKVVAKLESLPKKTKEFAQMLKNIEATKKTVVFFGHEEQSLAPCIRNIDGVSVYPVSSANTYTVVTHGTVIFTPKAVEELEQRVR